MLVLWVQTNQGVGFTGAGFQQIGMRPTDGVIFDPFFFLDTGRRDCIFEPCFVGRIEQLVQE